VILLLELLEAIPHRGLLARLPALSRRPEADRRAGRRRPQPPRARRTASARHARRAADASRRSRVGPAAVVH
jgi:hypothetical protein